MSHIATYGTTLTCVNPELFKEAVDIVLKQHGGKLRQDISEWGKSVTNWRGREFLLAFDTPELSYGMAAIINAKGDLEYVGESAQRHLAPKITKQIDQTYMVLATAQALRSMGYDIEAVMEAPDGNGIMMKGTQQLQ